MGKRRRMMVGSERRPAGSAPCHPGGASSSLVHSRGDEKLEHSAPDPPFPSSWHSPILAAEIISALLSRCPSRTPPPLSRFAY